MILILLNLEDFAKSKLSQSICVSRLNENKILPKKDENLEDCNNSDGAHNKSKSSNSKSKENSVFSFQGKLKFH